MSQTPESLVKYCTAEAASQILQSRSLRWSSPHLFLDPFELTHQTPLNFDPHTLLQAAIQAATAMIFAKDDPRGSSPLVNVIRRWRSEERFASPEEAEDVLKELLSQMVDARQALIDTVMADWRQFSRTIRITTFSAKPDNLSCWHRFADSHRGVAIRFQCGEYTELPEPRAVQYRSARPEVTDLKEQSSAILSGEQVRPQDHFVDKLCTKSPINKDEQEWRCLRKATTEPDADQSLWFEDLQFERAEVRAIYFGAFTPIAAKREIYALAKEKYSEARIYQAKPVPGKYEIEFERIAKK